VRERVGVLILAAEGAGTIAPRLEALRLHRLGAIEAATLPIAWAEISDANEIGAIVTAAAAEMQSRFGLRLGMIGVDTVAAAFNADENDAQLATAAMKALGKLASDARTLVVAVAHYGKSDGAGVRGSSAWTASADVILAATGDISELSGEVKNRTLALTKSRYAETGPISDFELRSVNVGLDEDGDPISAAVIAQANAVVVHAHQALYLDRWRRSCAPQRSRYQTDARACAANLSGNIAMRNGRTRRRRTESSGLIERKGAREATAHRPGCGGQWRGLCDAPAAHRPSIAV
jgi:hypothetical protein